MTQNRATMLRLIANKLTQIQRSRNGALEAFYWQDGRILGGHEARTIEWLEANKLVRCLGTPGLHGLTSGPMRPTPKGSAWLEADRREQGKE